MYKFIVLSLSLLGCTDGSHKTPNQPKAMEDVEIKSVEILSSGGELGYHTRILINKDSTHYKQTVAANPGNNSEYHKKTSPQDWKILIAKIDLVEFKASEEGKSVQPVDGIDTKISIVSNRDTTSKVNAYHSTVWKKIFEYVYYTSKPAFPRHPREDTK
ncbi:hypothetical protein [Sphingobacterium sp. HMA12]|uniref:hypothetical protein n=1 Tax=Sphingobacterium sp. HMA12 TaxID=2050894 RepID=UPI000CEA2573|nr:hypothetical protein [Sphingobacterium sp. HMA12]